MIKLYKTDSEFDDYNGNCPYCNQKYKILGVNDYLNDAERFYFCDECEKEFYVSLSVTITRKIKITT